MRGVEKIKRRNQTKQQNKKIDFWIRWKIMWVIRKWRLMPSIFESMAQKMNSDHFIFLATLNNQASAYILIANKSFGQSCWTSYLSTFKPALAKSSLNNGVERVTLKSYLSTTNPIAQWFSFNIITPPSFSDYLHLTRNLTASSSFKWENTHWTQTQSYFSLN